MSLDIDAAIRRLERAASAVAREEGGLEVDVHRDPAAELAMSDAYPETEPPPECDRPYAEVTGPTGRYSGVVLLEWPYSQMKDAIADVAATDWEMRLEEDD
jgi:hypothetical protein